jgi:hypothetical protein
MTKLAPKPIGLLDLLLLLSLLLLLLLLNILHKLAPLKHACSDARMLKVSV